MAARSSAGVGLFVVFLAAGAVPALSSAAHGHVEVERLAPRAGTPSPLEARGARRPAASSIRAGAGVFDGLSDPGITDAASNEVTPPDATGAVGPSSYVELVNSEIAVYDKLNLAAPTAVLDERDFVGDPSAVVCDGQIQWDEQGQRWLYTALDCGETAATESEGFFFGWSRTPSPDLSASNWCLFAVPTANTIEDSPKLGHDNTQIIIGANAYDDTSLDYLESDIFVFDKPSAGDTGCPDGATEGSTAVQIDDGSGFAPVPANIADSSPTGYVAATDDDGLHLDLYAIGRDTSDQSVIIGVTSVDAAPLNPPLGIPEPGSAATGDTLDPLDGRLTQAVAVTDPATGKEGIWTQQTLAAPVSSDGSTTTFIEWYELTPGSTSPTKSGPTPGVLNGSDAFNGAISPTSDGREVAIFYNSASPTQLPDFRVESDRSDSLTGPEDIQLATSGYEDHDFSCPSWTGEDDVPCSWGEYSGASPDPSNPCLVWGTGQITSAAPDPADGTPQWGTQNAAVDVCTYALTATKVGTGAGTVTSGDGVIACGTTCSYAYGYGTHVTLTASPSEGSTFESWSGACSGTGTCTVTTNQAESVTATFSLSPEELDVSQWGKGSGRISSVPAGISCGRVCFHDFDYGASVTVTAKPSAGSRFSGWSGACSGKEACTVSMTSQQSVGADFANLHPACVVPRVGRKPLSVAEAALRHAHCRTGKIRRRPSRLKRGRVISEEPRPGKHLKHGTKVTLVVSKGRHS